MHDAVQGKQATAFGQTVALEAQNGGAKALNGFKLENEVRLAACRRQVSVDRAVGRSA